MLLAARTEDDVSHLEVCVYEEAADDGEANLFVHHDLMLPGAPTLSLSHPIPSPPRLQPSRSRWHGWTARPARLARMRAATLWLWARCCPPSNCGTWTFWTRWSRCWCWAEPRLWSRARLLGAGRGRRRGRVARGRCRQTAIQARSWGWPGTVRARGRGVWAMRCAVLSCARAHAVEFRNVLASASADSTVKARPATRARSRSRA